MSPRGSESVVVGSTEMPWVLHEPPTSLLSLGHDRSPQPLFLVFYILLSESLRLPRRSGWRVGGVFNRNVGGVVEKGRSYEIHCLSCSEVFRRAGRIVTMNNLSRRNLLTLGDGTLGVSNRDLRPSRSRVRTGGCADLTSIGLRKVPFLFYVGFLVPTQLGQFHVSRRDTFN